MKSYSVCEKDFEVIIPFNWIKDKEHATLDT